MKNIIGLKEFRENMESYTSKVANGETIVVLKRAKPIFKIVPVSEEEVWQSLVDFTEFDPSGVSLNKIISALGNGQTAKSSKKAIKRA